MARLEVGKDEQPGHRGDGTRFRDTLHCDLASTFGLMPLSCGRALSRSWEEEGSKNLRRGSGCEDCRH